MQWGTNLLLHVSHIYFYRFNLDTNWETFTESCYYEGESNENLKFVIKNRNFAPLSCKLVSVLQTACRMACRWQRSADARILSQYQYKDGCPT